VYDIIAQYEKVKTLDLQNVITNTQIRVKNNTIRKSTSMEEEGSIKMQGLQASRTSAQELDERKARGLCFNCDGKWSKTYNCTEKRLFIKDNIQENK